MKQLLKKIKGKKPSKPPLQPISPGSLAGIAAGPLGLQAQPGEVSEDEGGGLDPQIVVPDRMDEGRQHHASEPSTSGETRYRDKPTVEDPDNSGGEGENERVEVSIVEKRDCEGTPPSDAMEAVEKFGPLKAVLGAIPAVYANREGSGAVTNKIETLISHTVALEEQFDSRPSDVAEQRRRDELIRELGRIKGQLESVCGNPGLQQPDDQVQDDERLFMFLESLREAISKYQIARQKSVDNEGSRSMDPAEMAVLNNIHCAQQAEYRHGDRNGCLKGTRSTVLDEIELWTHDFEKPPVYWLNGLAGTGKTTIAQTIAERVFAGGRLGASFFCSRDFEDRSNLKFIFPTLAVQLARKYPKFRSIFVPLIQSDPNIIHESLHGQMKDLIVQPVVESNISTVIVIDALDECKDDEPASAILSVLGQLVAEMPKTKFFVTGRPEPRIREGFRIPLLARAADVFVLHEVEPRQVNRDLRLYFKHKFSELKDRGRVLDDWPTETQLNLLCERAAGFFVYAVATVRFIDQKNKNPKRQLDRLLQSVESGLEGGIKFRANITLDSLYMSILQEAFNDNDTEDDSHIHSILGAVTLAANPLSPLTIATLLGLSVEDVLPFLSSVHSLLILQEGIDQPVRPFHKSFPDFIVDPARCTNPRFLICSSDQHAKLLVCCLELMNQALEKNMCQLPDGVTNLEVNDLKERTEQYISKPLEYACRSWHKHLVDKMSDQTVGILHKFLTEKFLFWLEVLSVVGAVREAVDALEVTMKWLDLSPTLDLARDYSRFVLAFFEVISTSAPHIYHSALPLSPKTSIVCDKYKQYMHPFVRVVHGLPDQWEPVVATMYDTDFQWNIIAWSPCNRFIAVGGLVGVEIHDAVTLNLLHTLKSPQYSSYDSSAVMLRFSPDGNFLILFNEEDLVTWDFQTGSSVVIYHPEGLRESDLNFSCTYSVDGKMLAVVYKDQNWKNASIATYDFSTTYTQLYKVSGAEIASIWTHNSFLQFATVEPGNISIWQIEFTSTHTPERVGSFLAPSYTAPDPSALNYTTKKMEFLPMLYQLAISFDETLLVWSAQDSKVLLKILQFEAEGMSFSSNGHFFACTSKNEVWVWKEFPTGYILHQRLSFVNVSPRSFLSPNGESIIVSLGPTIQLWHTKYPMLSSGPTATIEGRDFILQFSQHETSAAFVHYQGSTATILDLQSGDIQLVIDTDMIVSALGVSESAIVVTDGKRIITWNLVIGNARMNINNSIQITTLNVPPDVQLTHISISSGLNHVAIVTNEPPTLEIYDVVTGICLASTSAPLPLYKGSEGLWFTLDGHEVWRAFYRNEWDWVVDGWDILGDGWKIIEDSESGATNLQPLGKAVLPLGTPHWQSSHGYDVLGNGWVLGPTQKRLLWLPHHWRSEERCRTWSGNFLGLQHCQLPAVVILEFFK